MTPKSGSYCQHRYGGLYIIHGVSTSTVDKSKWVVYEHVYPFEREMWHRPYEEFTDGRFTIIDESEFLDIAESNSREDFKLQIGNARGASKK